MVADRPGSVGWMNERCWRCSAEMEWRHGTWQCPRCRLKLGCCEGEPQTSCEAAKHLHRLCPRPPRPDGPRARRGVRHARAQGRRLCGLSRLERLEPARRQVAGGTELGDADP